MTQMMTQFYRTDEQPSHQKQPLGQGHRRPHYPKAQRKAIVKANPHRPNAALATMCGVSERTILRDREELGLSKTLVVEEFDERQRALALALFEDQCPPFEIARTLGVTTKRIQQEFPAQFDLVDREESKRTMYFMRRHRYL